MGKNYLIKYSKIIWANNMKSIEEINEEINNVHYKQKTIVIPKVSFIRHRLYLTKKKRKRKGQTNIIF